MRNDRHVCGQPSLLLGFLEPRDQPIERDRARHLMGMERRLQVDRRGVARPAEPEDAKKEFLSRAIRVDRETFDLHRAVLPACVLSLPGVGTSIRWATKAANVPSVIRFHSGL